MFLEQSQKYLEPVQGLKVDTFGESFIDYVDIISNIYKISYS